jgi:hypothetical protein
LGARNGEVRFTSMSRHRQHDRLRPKTFTKSDISLSGHPKDLSYNFKPRGFYLQPGGAQNLA